MRARRTPLSLLAVLLAFPAAAAAQKPCGSEVQPPAPAAAAHPTDWALVEKEASETLSAYIHVNTTNPPGNEAKAAAFLACILDREGIQYTTWGPVAGKANLVARWPSPLPAASKKPALVLLNHMDVVPASPEYWSVDPFAGLIKDGYVWGRGAQDMKGMAITELEALLALKRSGAKLDRDVVFVSTSDEEVGGTLGAGDVARNHFELVKDAGAILNEGGDISLADDGRLLYYGITVTEKSPFWLDLVAHGRPGHASMPLVGSAPNRLVRALERIRAWRTPVEVLPVTAAYFHDLAKVASPELRPLYADIAATVRDPVGLAEIEKDPFQNALLRNTVSITMLGASNKVNVIPPEAHASLDVRLLPGQGQDDFLRQIRQVIGDDSVEVKPQGIGWPATVSPTTGPLYQALRTVALRNDPGALVLSEMQTGFTDCHFFREKGIDCYGFDPFRTTEADSHGVHGNDERVSLENLRFGTKFVYDVIRELAAR